MSRQITFAAEGPAAKQTDERTFARVLPHVQFQILLGTDAFAAKRTGETSFALLFCRVCAQETDNRGFVRVAQYVQTAAAGRYRVVCHRVDRVVLIGFQFIDVGCGALSCKTQLNPVVNWCVSEIDRVIGYMEARDGVKARPSLCGIGWI